MDNIFKTSCKRAIAPIFGLYALTAPAFAADNPRATTMLLDSWYKQTVAAQNAPLGNGLAPAANQQIFDELCRTELDCRFNATQNTSHSALVLTPEVMNILDVVNTTTNQYEPTDDEVQYGIPDKAVPYPANKKGDCEDYATSKFLTLFHEYNFNPDHMALAIVRYSAQENHAILLVKGVDPKTRDVKILVLDNLADGAAELKDTRHADNIISIASRDWTQWRKWEPRAAQFPSVSIRGAVIPNSGERISAPAIPGLRGS